MVKTKFYGVIVPMITPFNEKYEIDFKATKWLVNYLTDKGVHGIFPYSTTGEFVHLKINEGIKLVEIVLNEVKGKTWIIPGISSNCTLHSIEIGRKLMDMGVDGVIVTPPFFFKINIDQLKMHFSMIAEKIELPIIIYNIPSTTGINIPVNLYAELAKEYSNIVGAKVTFDNISYMRKLIMEVKSIRKDFSILTGLDHHLLNTLIMGGDGGIMALANVAPQIHLEIYNAWINNNLKGAIEAFRKLLKLVEIYSIASSFPTSVKTALKVLGAPIKPYVRPPLTIESKEIEDKIRKILDEIEVTI